MTRVSLAMPVYNGENFIEEALRSILAQDYDDFELIINDNASTDRTEEICRDYVQKDARVKYHRNPKNLGAAPNYNRGYELATGEYLKWCAHDDKISPNYVSECVRILDADPEVSLAYGRTVCIDGAGAEIPMVGYAIPNLEGMTPAERFGTVVKFTGTCFEIFGMYRMELLAKTSLHRLYYGSDRALLAETALLGKYARSDDAIFYNREHGDRSINIDDKRARRQWQFAEGGDKASFEHWGLLSHLVEISRKHPEVAPSHKMLAQLAGFAFTPHQISRYGLELVGAVSPNAQRWMRRKALGLSRAS